ncbi:hypothetical protein ACI77O_12975 [Pseudomonas tritici]|uniref:hypothetical protein n=1 Tax=Pseudomonas tritici TaxID=2745518 RepID=UPI00387B8E89
MSDMQLSFLSTEPTAYDVNSVDDGAIQKHPVTRATVATALSARAVDDTVLGLGFTNWRALIDHALRTGHFELFETAFGSIGLRKYGYRFGPIPALPVGGTSYVQQRLLLLSADVSATAGRHERMISAGPDFAHKCVVADGCCDLTVKQVSVVVRVSLAVDTLSYSETVVADTSDLEAQLEAELLIAGATPGASLTTGCKSLAVHMLRISQGMR